MVGKLFLLVIILLVVWVISWFVPPPTKNDKKTEETSWEKEKEQAKREHEAEKNREWFKEGRWLTDKEIDWACGGMKEKQMPGSFPGSEVPSKFKILPAHQFHLVREAQRWNKEEELFTYLLSELTSGDCEIVFIPVNQTNYHWSLLVFETKSKKFYHWDSLGGANWGYAEGLVRELLSQIHSTDNLNLKQFLVKRQEVRQNNGWECGIAIIATMKRIREKYSGSIKDIELGEFDFKKVREELRMKYLQEHS